MQKNTLSNSQLDALTKETYQVEETERHAFHAKIEIKQFNASTGERMSKPIIQKFGAKGFKDVLDGLQRQGYTVDVLYDPTDYLAQRRKARAAYQNNIAAVRAQQIADQQAAEMEALKAEMRKELLAEMEAEKKVETKDKKATK